MTIRIDRHSRAHLVLLVIALLLVGCGRAQANPTAASTGTPSGTPTPMVASSAAPAMTPIPGAPTCRLPVWGAAFVMEQNQASGFAGGFMAFPNGSFTFARDTMTNRPEQVSGWTYSLGRWLPAAPKAVAPDGVHYAWIYYHPNLAQDVHVVDAATGHDRVISSNTDLDLPMWQPDGLYLVHHRIGTDASHGLVRLDPATGTRTDVTVPTPFGSLGWEVGGGAAWTTDLAPNDPTPDNRFGQDRLERYDLITGQLTTWFYRQGHPISQRGYDGDALPVIAVADMAGSGVSQETIMRLTAPGSGLSILTSNHATGLMALPDPHGLWLVGQDGIYLSAAGESARLLSGFRGADGAGGPCQ